MAALDCVQKLVQSAMRSEAPEEGRPSDGVTTEQLDQEPDDDGYSRAQFPFDQKSELQRNLI